MKLEDLTINVKMSGYDEVKQKLNGIEAQIDRILAKKKRLCSLPNAMCGGTTINQGIAIQPEPLKPYPINEQHTINLYNLSPDKDIKKLADELCMYMKRCKSTAK